MQLLLIFFDDKGNYKLAKNLETAYKSSLPNQFEKDFIETDRKVKQDLDNIISSLKLD